MLLQITKVLKKEIGKDKVAKPRIDIVEGVKRTQHFENFVQVHLHDGSSLYYDRNSLAEVDNVKDTGDPYKNSEIWLLNDEGKTIRKIL